MWRDSCGRTFRKLTTDAATALLASLIGVTTLPDARRHVVVPATVSSASRRRSNDCDARRPYSAYLGVERFLCGEWDDALSELETSIDLIEDSGITFAAVTAHTAIALIRLHRADLPGAAQAIAATTALPQGPRYAAPRLTRARALLAEAEGDASAAHILLTDAWERCVSGGTSLDFPTLAPDLVRLSLDQGARDVAEEVTATLSDSESGSTVASRRASVERCLGLLADDPLALEAAADRYNVAGRVLDAALSRQQAATAAARHGNTQQARTLFAQARSALEGLNADHDLRHLEAQLRVAGMPPGKRGPRRRPASGWASLTGTERAVADLVAEGLTNPQIGARLFVSRRTVQTHVSHIFTKLDLTTRAQLAAKVATHRDHTG